MTVEKAVFIRGEKTAPQRPWLFFHFDEKRERDRSRRYELVYFDFPEGVRKTWNDWAPQRRWPPPKPNSTVELKRVKMLDWDVNRDVFVVIDRPLPTILNLYDWVKEQPANSIGSMQFFGHGDYSEPIIWEDCMEGGKPPRRPLAEPRHPNDTEPRRRDFCGSNPLSGIEGAKFWAPFAGDAFVKLWGCDAAQVNRDLVMKQAKKPTPSRAEDILDFVGDLYAMRLAQLLGVTVWAPPIGWGTRPDPQDLHPSLQYRGVWPPNWKTDRWWRVEEFGPEPQSVFRDFGAAIDPVRYVGYHPSWLARARAQQKAADPLQTTTPKQLQQQLVPEG